MKILWITNNEPEAASRHFNRINYAGTWINYSHELLTQVENIDLYVLSCGNRYGWTRIGNTNYAGFIGKQDFDEVFVNSLNECFPDIVHIWGTEYEHFLNAVKIMENRNELDKLIVSIQGLVSIIDNYYAFALPQKQYKRKTLYERLRHTSIEDAHRSMHIRGQYEIEGISIIKNCIGRTDWDRAITRQYNRKINYYRCNEILRKAFYETSWNYNDCEKHSIVFSQSRYILKGFHVMLDALRIVKQFYPDVKLYAVGRSPYVYDGVIDRIKRYSYLEYIKEKINEYELNDNVHFMGNLDEKQMVAHYKRGNVFVCASGIENSSNSVGEAMTLGMPIVASDVGGIKTFIEHNNNGIIYQSDSPNMLADGIIRVFEDIDRAIIMGELARKKAKELYNPIQNTNDLISIYEELYKKK